MPREIDESKPLSADDRQWLMDWGQYDVIERIDAEHGKQSEDPRESQAALDYTKLVEDLNAVLAEHGVQPAADPVAAVRQALAGVVRGNSDRNGPEDDRTVEALVDAQDPGQGDPPVEGTGGGGTDYSAMTADELRDELGSRELSRSGNKAELIARLQEDDDS